MKSGGKGMTDKSNELMRIGGRISVCRQNKNMTQEELAYRLGITPQALSKWERGVSLPDISMLADLSRLLEISTDALLGIGAGNPSEMEGGEIQLEIGANLRNSLEPLELIFGEKLVPFFEDNQFAGRIMELRKKLSRQGIWLPVFRIRDEMELKEQEFMVLAYRNVLYSEVMETIGEGTLDYMLQKLGEILPVKYYEILSPDLVKCLVDNLKVRYPVLIESIVPERISYGLLADVVRKVLRRGDSIRYLPRMIEAVDLALRDQANLSVDELAERAAQAIERQDNFDVMMQKR